MGKSVENQGGAPPPSPGDSELMSRVREGDEAAFEAIVLRWEDLVFNLAMRVIGNREEARDVAQEVFIRLWENPRAWKPEARFTTWLYRVTTNRALNRLRTLKLKSFLSLADYAPDDISSIYPAEAPDAGLIRNEEARRFMREFNRLPPRQRAALHLRYRENLPVAEVAGALVVSLKSAESLIFRGKQTLKKRLRSDA